MNLLNRAITVTSGEDGASNLEFIVIASVTLVIAAVLFLFRDKIMMFINNASNKVGAMQDSVTKGFINQDANANLINGSQTAVTPGP